MGRKRSTGQFTPLELEIMKILWEAGPATVQVVQRRLPAELAGREFTDQYACTALIYQFEQPGSGEGARLDVPSDLPGRIHLERAKLWEALGKPAIGY